LTPSGFPLGRKHTRRPLPPVHLVHIMYTSCILMGVTHPYHGGTPMASTQSDEAQLRTLAAEGLSQNEIAKRLDLPRSTVRDRIKKLGLTPPPDLAVQMSTQGIPYVHTDTLASMMPHLQELVTWWQERKATLHHASDTSRKTERITFHVEQRWIDAIRRQADLDGLTYTQIVNEAFRRYFEGKYT